MDGLLGTLNTSALLARKGQVLLACQERYNNNNAYRGSHYGLSLALSSLNAKHDFVPLDCNRFDHSFYQHKGTQSGSDPKVAVNNCVVWRLGRRYTHAAQWDRLYARTVANGPEHLIAGLIHDARHFKSLERDYFSADSKTVPKASLKATVHCAIRHHGGTSSPAVSNAVKDWNAIRDKRGGGMSEADYAAILLVIYLWTKDSGIEDEVRTFHRQRGGYDEP